MTTPNYHQLLIDAFNQLRTNARCTAAFSSWTIFTEADDEFLEECMSVFLKWTRVSDTSFSFSPSVSFDLPKDGIELEGEEREESSSSSDYESEYSDGPCIVCLINESCTDEMEDEDEESYIDYADHSWNDVNEEEDVETDSGLSWSSDSDDVEEEGTVPPVSTPVCPGPFSDLLSRLLPPSGSLLLIDGCLVPYQNTVSNVIDAPSISSLFLRDRSLFHYSPLSSSSSIDSHNCDFNCMPYVTLASRLEDADEKERLLEETTTVSSTTVSSLSSDWEESECETSKAMAIRLLKECDEMEERIEEMKKKLKKMMEEE